MHFGKTRTTLIVFPRQTRAGEVALPFPPAMEGTGTAAKIPPPFRDIPVNFPRGTFLRTGSWSGRARRSPLDNKVVARVFNVRPVRPPRRSDWRRQLYRVRIRRRRSPAIHTTLRLHDVFRIRD